MIYICPSCGRRTGILIDGLCKECFLKKNPIFFETDKKVKKCIVCGKYFVGNKSGSLKNISKGIIENVLKLNRIYKIKKLEVLETEEFEDKILIIFRVVVSYYDYLFDEKYQLEVDVEKFVCESCSKAKTGYYEAIIQLRSDKFEKIEEYKKILFDFFEKYAIKVSKIESRKEGMDFYVTDSKRARRLAEAIKKSFKNVEIKFSRKLHTQDRQTSKKVYKLTILIRFFDKKEF